MFTTLISPTDLAAHAGDPAWVLLDCRFDLTNPDAGPALYAASHIPGARYVHLDHDLSGAKTGSNGRHPLPSIDEMAARFGQLGIGPGVQVVLYDGDIGMYAARAWWMLRYLGHEAVAVLDGGYARWVAEGHAVTTEVPATMTRVFTPAPRADWRLSVSDVQAGVEGVLVDARSPERFRGLNETLDPVGGHIPGACNYFFQQNLTPEKTFKSPEALRSQWTTLLAGRPASEVVMYCGSGVTACHNLLALEVAGLSGARIYPGSWSEYCADRSRPIET
jgi:thiosulfate/3-mercaptopyruvate sulfurtransferase